LCINTAKCKRLSKKTTPNVWEGPFQIQFKSCGQWFEYTVFVAPIREDGLIGMDFLYDFDYQLSGLRLNGKRCATFVEKIPLRAVRVTSRAKVKIPANSECIIPGQTINLGSINSTLGILCPSSNKQPTNGISLGHTLSSPRTVKSHQIPIRLLNTSSSNVTLVKGATLGFLQEFDPNELLKMLT